MSIARRLRRTLNRRYALLYQRFLGHGEMESKGLRRLFASLFDINVGMYSYGCFDPIRFDGGISVGRYCSFATTCRRMNGNHGLDFLTLHPYTYNVKLGVVQHETIQRSRLTIDDDVWVGHNAIILPNVGHIGRGAVIGAGAVVTKDVPAYSIVAGNPARVIRKRFTDEIIDVIEATQWWLRSKEELSDMIRTTPELVLSPAQYFVRQENA